MFCVCVYMCNIILYFHSQVRLTESKTRSGNRTNRFPRVDQNLRQTKSAFKFPRNRPTPQRNPTVSRRQRHDSIDKKSASLCRRPIHTRHQVYNRHNARSSKPQKKQYHLQHLEMELKKRKRWQRKLRYSSAGVLVSVYG